MSKTVIRDRELGLMRMDIRNILKEILNVTWSISVSCFKH